MRKIHFTVFAQAYYVDATWGFGCPSGGIKNFGDLCHAHGIPVTWLVSPRSARCEVELFSEYHENHGDEIAMMFRFPTGPTFHHDKERHTANTLSIDDYRKLIRDQKAAIEQHLPWASIKVAGQGIRTPAMMEALRLEGFEGFFGHCYCQVGTDSITDMGMPWGSFPMRAGDTHLPASPDNDSGIVAFEWTMRDLNRSFHSTFPELWSTDPNDVERGGVCSDTNVEYWKALYLEYEKALSLNDHGIWFQFHQEAHEQTWGEICKPFTEERVRFCTGMMDRFFEWLVERDAVEFMTATPAARLYKRLAPAGTIPMHVPYAWTPVPKEMAFWTQVRGKTGYAGLIHKNAYMPVESLYEYLVAVNGKDPVLAMERPPWMRSFFYFDADCQLVFDEGIAAPVALFNYLNHVPDPDLVDTIVPGGGQPGFFLEPVIPVPNVITSAESITIEVINQRDTPLPYGVFLWDIEVQGPGTATTVSCKVVPGIGTFARLTLAPGHNEIQLGS